MIIVRKIYEGAYWASFTSRETPADFRSSSPLSAQDVIDELSRRGAARPEIDEALGVADQEWKAS